ncbi:hypothetical protein KFK09_026699 [Dendrobium nobile]|uniref:Uncharacterized protein n=1 Tax=Dendrobium nobile TaxID=94219 RepID=A0A8T3A7J6_DENNO|nr:hypothetical protein KFK09_026699 [Dendrobium nobile]
MEIRICGQGFAHLRRCCSASLFRRRCRDCTRRFFGSFVAVRLRFFHDFPFLSDRRYDILIGSNNKGSSPAMNVTFSLSHASSAKSRKSAEPRD